MAIAVDFTQKRVLIVDDHPGMLSSMRATMSAFGVTMSNTARNANEALFRVKSMRYDIIVCDYFLGDGADGQQLLEHLRGECVISPLTVFMMVTAERGYEKVVSAAEFAPDDYLVKPFSAETMRLRLERVVEKKLALAKVYTLIEEGAAERALDLIDELIAARSKYVIDLMRLKAELNVSLGRRDEAQKLYQQVIALRAVPWARLGLSQVHLERNELDEAQALLTALVAEKPDYLAAYDLLAKVHEAQGRDEDAKGVLKTAMQISPRTLHRHKHVGDIAYRNGELEEAEAEFTRVVEKGRHSFSRKPDDFLKLSRVYMDRDKFDAALGTLQSARASFGRSEETAVSTAVMESLVHRKAGNEEASAKAIGQALALARDKGVQLDEATTLDMAKACYLNNMEQEGAELVRNAVTGNHESQQLLAEVKKLYADVGREQQGESIVAQAVDDAVKINNEGVMKARQGDLDGAIVMLEQAAAKMPNNAHVVMNAAHSLIAHMLKNGPQEDKLRRVARYIAETRKRNPTHPKFVQVNQLYQDMVRRQAPAPA
ncbi:MAG TPA: tetratricopeptide repeat protein [Burkholderiales bacterium]|nr:tetratricopeptide repeat protein [Burkholderiales bacterium]